MLLQIVLKQTAFKNCNFLTKLHQLNSKYICTTPTNLQLQRKTFRIPKGSKEQKLKLDDDVPSDYDLIYNSPLQNWIWAAKHISSITALSIGGVAAHKYFTDDFDMYLNFQLYEKLVMNPTDIYYFSAGFVTISLAVRWVIAKYPLRIYRGNEDYIAVYSPQLPFSLSKNHFKRGDIEPVRHMLNPWKDAMYRTGKKTSLLFMTYFRTPSDFHEMFDKE